MKKVVLFLIAGWLVVSCGQQEATTEVAEVTVDTEQMLDDHKNVVPTAILKAEIAGMTCVKGCGSSIRKELYSLGGVSKVDFDNFDEEEDFNNIKIYYDENKVSQDDIILAITTLEDHKYSLEGPSSEKIVE